MRKEKRRLKKDLFMDDWRVRAIYNAEVMS